MADRKITGDHGSGTAHVPSAKRPCTARWTHRPRCALRTACGAGAVPTAASRLILAACEPEPGAFRPRQLLGRVRLACRARNLSRHTQDSYLGWIRRFVLFLGNKDPPQLEEQDLRRFLSHLATERKAPALTRNQPRGALLFLYREALSLAPPWLGSIPRARVPRPVPLVLT